MVGEAARGGDRLAVDPMTSGAAHSILRRIEPGAELRAAKRIASRGGDRQRYGETTGTGAAGAGRELRAA